MDVNFECSMLPWKIGKHSKCPLEKSPEKYPFGPGIVCVYEFLIKESMVLNSDRLEKFNSSPGKPEFTDLRYGIMFFQGRPGILDPPSSMIIFWKTPMATES